MKKLSLLVLIATMSMAGGALADQKVPKNRFQTISYQVSQEQLVTSQTAKVSVLLNATVPSKNINALQALAKSELEKLAPQIDWHIESYRQHKLSSGMIAIDMTLSSRVTSQVLSAITDGLAGINKSGHHYSIAGINYSPSAMQIEQAKALMRLSLLQRIGRQVRAINKQMDSQYVIKSVIFDPRQLSLATNVAPMPLYRTGDAMEKQTPLSVSYKVHMDAAVTLIKKMTQCKH